MVYTVTHYTDYQSAIYRRVKLYGFTVHAQT